MDVVGCDVARGAWVAVVLRDGVFAGALLEATLAGVVARCREAACITVDIPIGLPEAWPRPADVEARAFVGPRRSSVFFTPVREAVEAPDYQAALAASVAVTGKGISRQAYALSRMILDAEPVAAADERVHEAHPEVSFREMAGEPLAEAKTSWNGLHRRIGLLAGNGIELPGHLSEAGVVRPDDLVDAAAIAWTAARLAAGRARALGDPSYEGRDRAIYV